MANSIVHRLKHLYIDYRTSKAEGRLYLKNCFEKSVSLEYYTLKNILNMWYTRLGSSSIRTEQEHLECNIGCLIVYSQVINQFLIAEQSTRRKGKPVFAVVEPPVVPYKTFRYGNLKKNLCFAICIFLCS